MTREELITELNNRIGFETDYEAYSMSDSEREFYTDILKILEQEPCEDCISRQYLIDIATKDGAYDYVSAQEIANAPSVKPQEPKTDILDKIRAEIEQTAKDYDKFDDYRRVRGLWIALDIINKYRQER